MEANEVPSWVNDARAEHARLHPDRMAIVNHYLDVQKAQVALLEAQPWVVDYLSHMSVYDTKAASADLAVA